MVLVSVYREAFRGLPREVWLLSAAALINRAGTMVLPFLSLYLDEQLGFSKQTTGMLILAFGLGSVVGSYLGGWVSERLGPVRVQELSLLAGGSALMGLGRLETLPMLWVGLFVAAALGDAFRPALMAACADATAPESRTRALALVRLAINLGMGIGPAVGGLLAARNYQLLFLVDGLTCWAGAAMLWWTVGRIERRQRKEESAAAPEPMAAVWRDWPFMTFLALVFLLGLSFFQIFFTLPLYYHEVYGLSERTIGLAMSLNALVIVLVEMPLVRALERWNHLLVFGAGALLVGLGIGVLPLGRHLSLVIASTLVWTLGEMLSLPFSNGLVAARAGSGTSSRHMGMYSMTFSVAFVVAPPLGLAAYGAWGGDTLCLAIAGLGMVVLAGTLGLRSFYGVHG
ncbi:MAG TPA: MFS transporter [Acidobacteria bacterium]|nr:MFS transporter [Acidobacteriota bacterium]